MFFLKIAQCHCNKKPGMRKGINSLHMPGTLYHPLRGGSVSDFNEAQLVFVGCAPAFAAPTFCFRHNYI